MEGGGRREEKKKKKKRGRREGEDCWVCLCTPVVVGNLPALKPAHILSGFEEEGHEPQQGHRENNRTALRPALFFEGGGR